MSVKNKQDELYCREKRCISTSPPLKRARNSTEEAYPVTILDVLDIHVCRRAVLRFLPLADLLRSECVCHRWRDVIVQYIQGAGFRFRLHVVTPWHQPVLPPDCRAFPLDETQLDSYARNLFKWGKSVEAAPCSADSFTTVAEHCPNLQELTLYGIPDQDTVKEYLGKLVKLKRLGFRDPPGPPTGASVQLTDNTIQILLENDIYEELTIAGVEKLTGTCFNKLTTNLTSLRLQDCPALEFHLLKSALDSLRDLKTLKLTGLASEILQNIHVLLDNMDKLERLELCRYDAVEMADLHVFERLESLKHLNLSHNLAVKNEWLKAVAVGCKLESLDVSYCHGVSTLGLECVCRACAWTMKELSVAGNNHLIDEHIETFIRLCPNLSVLNAQECKGLSQYLVFFLARLMRRRKRHRLPVLLLRLYGTSMPYCMIRKKFMSAQSLILDFSKDSRVPETFEPDQILRHHFPSGMLLSAAI